MARQKVWLTREMTVGHGIGQRQSFIEYEETTGLVVRPDERLGEIGRKEWDRIMTVLVKLKLGHIVDGPGLLDHCLKVQRETK